MTSVRPFDLKSVPRHAQAGLSGMLGVDRRHKFRNSDFIGEIFSRGADLERMEGLVTINPRVSHLANGVKSAGSLST